MKIAESHSHQNGYEHILIHKRALWAEIHDVIASVGAGEPGNTATTLATNLGARGGQEVGTLEHQRRRVGRRQPVASGPQGGLTAEMARPAGSPMLVKDRSLCEIRLGVDAQDMSVEFSWQRELYEADLIDVGIVLLPTKATAGSVRTGVATYEGELSSLRRRHGRGMPAVPLVLIAIAPD
ncbi:MAG: hypothetical protein M9936_25075 [Caldilinea sp.]|nr:hypothetical protein [Caldilineaceae bacterium]MCB9121531.1 hypothetical protein [Caldilineaceae bacterium]MCB9123175.1 hypothetical protein [Caldilineaceae bacterium]MCO5212986.1 hypothetical protein [Caldilinea sp.]MCW5841897.1 hypothetical protein [Caldilinea sp.]